VSFSPVEIDETVTQQLIERADTATARSPQPQRGGPGEHRKPPFRQLPHIEPLSRVNTRQLAAQLCEVLIDRVTLRTNGVS
jgi:hypothetical protein